MSGPILDCRPSALLAFPCSVSTVGNLTAQTPYEISAWAKTDLGDSPLAFEHVVTKGVRPPAPSLKAKALNQTAVECTWTGPRNVVSEPGWCCPGSMDPCVWLMDSPRLSPPLPVHPFSPPTQPPSWSALDGPTEAAGVPALASVATRWPGLCSLYTEWV